MPFFSCGILSSTVFRFCVISSGPFFVHALWARHFLLLYRRSFDFAFIQCFVYVRYIMYAFWPGSKVTAEIGLVLLLHTFLHKKWTITYEFWTPDLIEAAATTATRLLPGASPGAALTSLPPAWHTAVYQSAPLASLPLPETFRDMSECRSHLSTVTGGKQRLI